MDATKLLIIISFIFTSTLFGQNSLYPKDTIYVKYEAKKENKKWTEKYGKYKNEKDGIFFNIKDTSNKTMSFFFNKENKVDTLCNKHLKDYRFLSLEEIDELRPPLPHDCIPRYRTIASCGNQHIKNDFVSLFYEQKLQIL